jgi:hypothetical protein
VKSQVPTSSMLLPSQRVSRTFTSLRNLLELLNVVVRF